MIHQDHSYRERLVDLRPLPARPLHNQARRGWGTILGFAVTFAFILGVTLSGLGLPNPVARLIQTSDQR